MVTCGDLRVILLQVLCYQEEAESDDVFPPHVLRKLQDSAHVGVHFIRRETGIELGNDILAERIPKATEQPPKKFETSSILLPW